MARGDYRVEVFSRLRFTNLKDAKRLQSLYVRTMKDLGLDTDGNHYSDRWASVSLFEKQEGMGKHQLHLDFTHRRIHKVEAEEVLRQVLNVTRSLTKRFGFDLEVRDVKSFKHSSAGVVLSLGWGPDDGVYFELERMMDTRIDCHAAAG